MEHAAADLARTSAPASGGAVGYQLRDRAEVPAKRRGNSIPAARPARAVACSAARNARDRVAAISLSLLTPQKVGFIEKKHSGAEFADCVSSSIDFECVIYRRTYEGDLSQGSTIVEVPR